MRFKEETRRRGLRRFSAWGMALSGLLSLILAATNATAQGVFRGTPSYCPPPPVCQPAPGHYPSVPGTVTPGLPPVTGQETGQPPVTGQETGQPPVTEQNTGQGQLGQQGIGDLGQGGQDDFSMAAPSRGGSRTAALGGDSVARANTSSNYIDSAIPMSQVRIRYDALFDNNAPDRGEFFYPKCGCFRLPPFNQLDAEGPPLPERNIDSSQEVSAYLEYAFMDSASAFVEIPVRFINPEVNANESGIGDVNFGFKYAFINCPDRVVTFQFRTYTPTGDGFKGLGTEHFSVEPALLVYQQLTDRLFFEGEIRDWISIGGSDFAGNVLRYGGGIGYIAAESCNWRITPIAELVGWTFLDGKRFTPSDGVVDATGDTIVNAKLGVRLSLGKTCCGQFQPRSDIGISYGRALTGEVLYKDIFRLEYRLRY